MYATAPCAGVLKIVGKAIFQRLAFLPCVVYHLAHPEPGFGEDIVVVTDVHGAVEIASGRVPVSCLCFDDATFEKFPAVIAEHRVSAVIVISNL